MVGLLAEVEIRLQVLSTVEMLWIDLLALYCLKLLARKREELLFSSVMHLQGFQR